MTSLLIAADDRTGALEVAGVAAESSGATVPVVVGVDRHVSEPGGITVIDLGSRHRPPSTARRLAREVDGVAAERHVHKIDSTLRGSWADELVARTRGGTRPVLVVPALPALGRTCEGGVVLVDGRPVDEGPTADDALAPPASARPAELLRRAGAATVRSVVPDDVATWATDATGIAVCDARSDDDVCHAVTSVRCRSDVLIAGPSVVAAHAVDSVSDPGRTPKWPRASSCLVVCGSLHPIAVEQVEWLVGAGARRIVADDASDSVVTVEGVDTTVVLLPPRPATGRVGREAAATTAARMAHRSVELIERLHPDAIVVIGGDTAAAVLGDTTVHVGGMIAVGCPWGTTADERLVVTRAGGFGGPEALLDLVRATLAP